MTLTNIAINKAAPKDKPYKLSDAGGLFLYITPAGGKSWRWKYRVNGKEKTMTFGLYPDIGLAQARELHAQARKDRALGSDPMVERMTTKLVRRIAADNSFSSVALAWHEQWRTARNARHADYVLRRLQSDVFPILGARPISEIQAIELVGMVKKITARGALDIAKRCYQTCGQVFRYAVAHGLARSNPVTNVKPSDILPSRKRENFARIGDKELPELMRQIEAYQGAAITRLAMKLMALTFVRTSELIGARWEEFDFEKEQWRIPASRMKMKTEHIVPLAPQTLEVLLTLKLITGHSKLLFPGERDHEKCMSNNTILAALRRMGYHGRMTGHGFRGVASTILHEQGFEHEHIELQLAHMERNAVSAAYNHAKYLKQRTDMMKAWAKYLEKITKTGVVQELRAA